MLRPTIVVKRPEESIEEASDERKNAVIREEMIEDDEEVKS